MNIIKVRQEERKNHVSKITATIKETFDNGQLIDYDKLLMATKVHLNLSPATTKDYIDRALFHLGIKKEDLNNEVFVKLWKETAQKDV